MLGIMREGRISADFDFVKEANPKTKLFWVISQLIYVATLSFGSSDTSSRHHFPVQDVWVGSSVFKEGLGVELLLLLIHRSQMRWFGHVVGNGRPVEICLVRFFRHIPLIIQIMLILPILVSLCPSRIVQSSVHIHIHPYGSCRLWIKKSLR